MNLYAEIKLFISSRDILNISFSKRSENFHQKEIKKELSVKLQLWIWRYWFNFN